MVKNAKGKKLKGGNKAKPAKKCKNLWDLTIRSISSQEKGKQALNEQQMMGSVEEIDGLSIFC